VGQAKAITTAVRRAQISPADIGHVNCHATSTPLGDRIEVTAMRNAIGEHPVLTAPKSALGHLLGAAGAVEAILTVLAVHHGVVPPTRNLESRRRSPRLGHRCRQTTVHVADSGIERFFRVRRP
jgi:3-oxoacyl-[acyl-carrier-protein] synthase II